LEDIQDFHLFFSIDEPDQQLPGNPEIVGTSGSGQIVISSGLDLILKCRLKIPESVAQEKVTLMWTVPGLLLFYISGP
jgi:hypothetical protein